MKRNLRTGGRARPFTFSPCHLVTLSLILGGCDLPGKPAESNRPLPADQVMDFDGLYKTNCAGCHGADGKLGPGPPLNDPLFLAIVPDEKLLPVIREGRAIAPGKKSLMPGFSVGEGSPLSSAQIQVWSQLKEEAHAAPRQQATLTATQVQVLAEGIKKRWGTPTAPAGGAPPYVAPAETNSGKKDEGNRVFARACAGCHGKEGEGIESDGRPRRKIHDPAFLALISDQELRRYVITGRADFGMPAYNGKDGRPPDFQPLTSAQVGDLVALLASWRQTGPAHGE
jgi:cytochrome c oxidase cbb3-type subunit III